MLCSFHEVIDVAKSETDRPVVVQRPAEQAASACPQCGAPMSGVCGEPCRNCGFHLGCGTEP